MSIFLYETYIRGSYHGTRPYSQGLTGSPWKYPFANGFGVHNVIAHRLVHTLTYAFTTVHSHAHTPRQ